MLENAPTFQEIIQLTRHELTTARKDDPIRECGRAALSLLRSDPELCLRLAYQKLHDVPYKEVKTCWRRLYADASLWKVVKILDINRKELGNGATEGKSREQDNEDGKCDWVDEVVRLLDMALILTGAPRREELVELCFLALKAILPVRDSVAAELKLSGSDRPAKRRKFSSSLETSRMPSNFPTDLPKPAPILRYPVPRASSPSLSVFQKRLGDIKTHTPLIIERAIDYWPALDERPWNRPAYLLEQTLGGRRLVPVEVGKSYTDEGWGQRIVTFRYFMETHMLNTCSSQRPDEAAMVGENERGGEKPTQTGYLAQHDLFVQIPALRADISIPDYCYCDPVPSPHLTHIKSTPKLEEPLLNAWFGPANTVSPLHTDPYHNILAQVVGYKYVRLYAPEETARLYPRGVEEGGVDMSNTSQVDLDEGMALYPEISCRNEEDDKEVDRQDMSSEEKEQRKAAFEEQFPGFREARYIEGILGPGECLYLPVGWWHYVRSLTPSFSVSFWFN